MNSLMTNERTQALGAQLFAQSSLSCIAVLDGASIPRLLPELDEHEPEHVCLFRGEQPQDVLETAPYLVRLERDAPFTQWLLMEGWGRHWGIFALTTADFQTARKHFRKFLLVKRHDGLPMYFRYYDPRVFRAFLPTCDREQLDVLYGPIERYVMEDRDPVRLNRFRAGSSHPETVDLGSPAFASASNGR